MNFIGLPTGGTCPPQFFALRHQARLVRVNRYQRAPDLNGLGRAGFTVIRIQPNDLSVYRLAVEKIGNHAKRIITGFFCLEKCFRILQTPKQHDRLPRGFVSPSAARDGDPIHMGRVSLAVLVPPAGNGRCLWRR